MGILVAALIVLLIAAVVAVVSGPLRRRVGADAGSRPDEREADATTAAAEVRIAELDAAREAKYQEIRDAELDFRTGKLSRGDYETIDAALRAEAIQILDRLEAVRGGEGGPRERA